MVCVMVLVVDLIAGILGIVADNAQKEVNDGMQLNFTKNYGANHMYEHKCTFWSLEETIHELRPPFMATIILTREVPFMISTSGKRVSPLWDLLECASIIGG